MMILPSGNPMNLFRIVAIVVLALALTATCVHAQGGGSFDLFGVTPRTVL